MAFLYNKTTIPASGAIYYNGINIKKVVYDGITVWQYVPPTKTITSAGLAKTNAYLGTNNAKGGSTCTVSGNNATYSIGQVGYYTAYIYGHTTTIDFTGYTKVRVNGSSAEGTPYFSVGSYGGNLNTTFSIANIGKTNINFSFTGSENSNYRADRSCGFTISSIVLSG